MSPPLTSAQKDVFVMPRVSTILAPLSLPLPTLPETNLSEYCFYCRYVFAGVFSGNIVVCLYILDVLGAACVKLKPDPTWVVGFFEAC